MRPAMHPFNALPRLNATPDREDRPEWTDQPDRPDRQDGGALQLERRPKTKRPRQYRVLLHNDDYTTREFVIQVLEEIFHRTHTEATQLMLHVHMKGLGVAGVYTREIAETKVEQTTQAARNAGMPLLCTMEPESDPE